MFSVPVFAMQAMQAVLGDTGYHNACDTLLHWYVFTEEEVEERQSKSRPEAKKHRRFRRHRLQFASAYIAAMVGRFASASVRRLCASFLLQHHGDAGMAGAAGNQFERLVHATLPHIPAGTQLTLKLLESGKEFHIRLPPSTPQVFSSVRDAASASKPDGSVYLMPVSSNQAAIDCLLSPKLLFQVGQNLPFMHRCPVVCAASYNAQLTVDEPTHIYMCCCFVPALRLHLGPPTASTSRASRKCAWR